MGSFAHKRIVAIFGAFAALFIALAVVGAVRSYSPIPLADMWDGYLYFFVHATQGEWSMWWAQHNEHRIALARMLFWIDLGVFHGNGIFLIVANYALAASAALVLFSCLVETLGAGKHVFPRNVLGLFILSLLFSWLQKENFAWGFQSQFFLAQLVPLCAFLLLHKSSEASSQSQSVSLFAAACVAGIAALGSMANGVLALPLMCLLAMALRMGCAKVALLALLAVVGNVAYFHDFHAPGAHSSLKDALLQQPLQVLQYVLLYLGNPFFYITGKGSRFIAKLAGLLLVVSAMGFSWRALKSPYRNAALFYPQRSLQLALLTFLLYIGGTALGTAGGRLVFGIDQAISGRYTTPTLMAWAVLLILYAPALAKRIEARPVKTMWIFLVPLILLLPFQLRAFESHAEALFERKVGVLAAELGIRDQPQIAAIYPSVDGPIARIKEAAPRGLTIFGDPDFKDAIDLVGTRETIKPAPQCQGQVGELNSIENESRFVRIDGWLFEPGQKAVPRTIHLLDESGRVVGYAFTGQAKGRTNADAVLRQAGFKGYVLAEMGGKPLVLQGLHPDCQLRAHAPQVAFDVKQSPFGSDPALAGAQAVTGATDWLGADAQKTAAPGRKVMGSFVHGDRDTGSVTLQLKRGDVIYYRSGPVGGKQVLTDADGIKHALPVAENWVALSFVNPTLPDVFVVKLSDEGAGWGEWSAIGLKD